MAKKTTKTTEVVEEETPKEEINYEKDLKDKSFEQILDTPKEEPAKEEPKDEVKPKEEETEMVEFDPEQLKKEAVQQAKEELGDLLKGKTDEETKENVDEFQEYQKDFFEKNNRQPTWFEVAQFTKEQLRKEFDAEQAQKAKEAEEEKTKQTEAQQKNQDDTNKYVKDTLDDLYTNDKLPKIQDAKNPDDYGLRVQKAFLSKVVDVNSKRMADGQTPKTLKEVFYEDFEIPAKEVAGANEPVNMGRGGFTPEDNQEMDYMKDIAGPRNSIRNILNNAFKKNA